MCEIGYTGIRYIRPDSVRFFNNIKSNALGVEIDGTIYDHVKVYRTSPSPIPIGTSLCG